MLGGFDAIVANCDGDEFEVFFAGFDSLLASVEIVTLGIRLGRRRQALWLLWPLASREISNKLRELGRWDSFRNSRRSVHMTPVGPGLRRILESIVAQGALDVLCHWPQSEHE